VVDFACVPLRLVIEIDGGVHEREEVVLNDHYRRRRSRRWAGPSSASPTPKPWPTPPASTPPSVTARRCWASNLPSPIGRGLERTAAQPTSLRERVRVARRPPSAAARPLRRLTPTSTPDPHPSASRPPSPNGRRIRTETPIPLRDFSYPQTLMSTYRELATDIGT
jgi:hypothetical protein